MKLEMTLPERPGFLHAVPILNIFVLMQFFFLLGPSLVTQSGVTVEMPPSRFQLARFQDPIVVTLSPGEPGPQLHLGRDAVTTAELAERLDELRAAGAQVQTIVLLQTDKGTPVGVERGITEMVLSKGFQLAMVGENTPAQEPEKLPTP